ncbi:MAG TPA: ROK family protein [Tepidisphaeraceae bacterium]|nr:ROK family protein [Tepidisphaeraceae bacterium]
MVSLGIDIGGTSTKVVARRGDQLLWTGQSKFYVNPDKSGLIHAIRSAVAGRIKTVDTVGMCVPGLFDVKTQQVTQSVNVPGLNHLSLARLVEEALGEAPRKNLAILNDAVATAHDLWRSRGLSGRLLVWALGTGVGASVLDDGVPLRVEGISPGHLGQIDVSIEDEPVVGPDGGAGGLEGYIGAGALSRKYGPDISAALDRFDGSEPPLRALVRAIRIAHAIYRPNHIVLCGGIGIRLRRLLPVMRTMIDDRLTSVARPDWDLSTGDNDFHAAKGAAAVATERQLEVVTAD